MDVQDDIFLGSGFTLGTTASKDPTLNQGVGPMGRIAFLNIVPLTKQTNNLATVQHTTASAKLTLTAGTGVTAGTAPDGTAVLILDCERALALTSSADMHLVSLTIVGYDIYWQPMTQTKALGSSATTVNTTKAFYAIASITASATDGTNNVSVGTADIFGLLFACADGGYILPKWAGALALDAGTFVAADATTPATATTGDTRGTYAPSSASDGTKRLVLWQHITGPQCGPLATRTAAVGVTPA